MHAPSSPLIVSVWSVISLSVGPIEPSYPLHNGSFHVSGGSGRWHFCELAQMVFSTYKPVSDGLPVFLRSLLNRNQMHFNGASVFYVEWYGWPRWFIAACRQSGVLSKHSELWGSTFHVLADLYITRAAAISGPNVHKSCKAFLITTQRLRLLAHWVQWIGHRRPNFLFFPFFSKRSVTLFSCFSHSDEETGPSLWGEPINGNCHRTNACQSVC